MQKIRESEAHQQSVADEQQRLEDEAAAEAAEEDGTAPSAAGGDSTAGAAASVTREHKRLKHWGKKNKKLRDKTPYAEENGLVPMVAYSMNRHNRPADNQKLKRQDPRQVRRRVARACMCACVCVCCV